MNVLLEKTIDKILIIDDEQEWLDILVLTFSDEHWNVKSASSAVEGIKLLQKNNFDLILCDMSMPGLDGIGLLKKIRSEGDATPFIIMTGMGTIRTAVEAVQFGAYNYITKPFKAEELKELAQQALEHGRMHEALKTDNEENHAGENEHADFTFVLGSSKILQDILFTARRVAGAPVPVLIQGETGTGKTLLARHIHGVSPRRAHPLLTIDCGALPETLLESELFGHVKGAFTGAVSSRRGLLADAEGGTIFLDEIGELSPSMQLKLLHAIQEKEIRPIGANHSIQIDVRFICATNCNLSEDVASGSFRKDLYYRLAVIPITLPPLRERRDDIIIFVGYFVQKFNKMYGRNISQVSPAALKVLLMQPWEGNIRELENVIERAVLMNDSTTIQPLSLGLGTQAGCSPEEIVSQSTEKNEENELAPQSISLQHAVFEAERKAIFLALTLSQGNKKQAAIMLGIGRRTLYQKLKEYYIDIS